MAGLPVCFGQAGRPNSGRAFGNNYGSLFCQAIPSVLGATDLGFARSVLPASSIATITRKIPSFTLPSARFSIWCPMRGTTLLFSQNAGTDLAKPRSVAPRSQSAITLENCYSYRSWLCLFERALVYMAQAAEIRDWWTRKG
jgi:hypothetical protein